MRSTSQQVILGLVLVLYFLPLVTCPRSFCSPKCATKGCNGNTQDKCNSKCMTNWIVSGNTCDPNNANNFYLHQTTGDIGSGLVVIDASTGTTQTPSTFCSPFSLYGPYTRANTIRVSAGAISVAYYQLTIYLGIVSMDAAWSADYWDKNMVYSIQFADPIVAVQTNTYKLYGPTKVQNQRYCYQDSKSQYWNRITQSYTYNITGVTFLWSITNLEPINASATWGFREFIVAYRTCDWRCLTCYGGANSQCTSCLINTTHYIYQSGNTCDLTCAVGYGIDPNSNVCILCDPYCTVCYAVLTNCSACVVSGTYVAYLYSVNSSCLPTCPSGYFANKVNQTCDICGGNCSECLNIPTYCTACPVGFGYASHVCYSPCPTGYFSDNGGLNCTACSSFCIQCLGPANLCTVCTMASPYTAYLYNTTAISGSCERTCPQGWYPETYSGAGPNLCLACDVVCTACSGFPTPCSICATGYYYYQATCINPCPTDYFAFNVSGTGQCLDCATYCVGVTMSMYFSSITNQQIWVDMVFNWALDYNTFDMTTFQTITIQSGEYAYTLDMFDVTYTAITSSLYRIKIAPKSYIFLYNATFVVTTRDMNGVLDHSLIGYPFAQTNYGISTSKSWFLIKGPPYSDLQINVMSSFSRLATKTKDLLAKPYIQEIQKTGVFNLLFSGAQITSCSMLSNQIQSQNMYEGVRFWATFVFFDAPPYEEISNQTKRFVSPTVQDQIRNAQQLQSQPHQRKLFSTDTMYWRFQRTGQTSFFIYDCYMPVFLIILCWILLFIAYKCQHMHWHPRHAGKIFSATHKIHEISLLYILMASILEFTYFETTSVQRFVSAGICAVFNLYFIIYELYIYYDMLKYPMAEIGNRLYDYYVLRYGFFLKNIRYIEYDINQEWSVKHWFRPYNYHFLSYYKKFLMIIALPLFYNVQYAQMAILLTIQLLQMIRFWFTWPFVSEKRNWIRLSLQISLFLFFLMNIIQINLLNTIQSGDINQLSGVISMFYGVGWAGFIFCFYFNVMFVIFGVYDLCIGLRVSNREKMDNARKKYYYDKIKQYEKDNEEASKDLVNRWVRLGNINNSYYGQLPEINVRIEEYIMRTTLGKFDVSVRKIDSLKMMKPRSHRKKNNTVTSKKIEKKRVLEKHSYPQLYEKLHSVYKTHSNNHVEQVILKTFINVLQQEFDQGQEVPLNRNNMFQRVELVSFDNERQEKELEQMVEGFPLPAHLFENF